MKATTPTVSSANASLGGGTPLAGAGIKPLPLGPHAPQVSKPAAMARAGHFQTPAALPHMIHPTRG